jgi:hypothetical protein
VQKKRRVKKEEIKGGKNEYKREGNEGNEELG